MAGYRWRCFVYTPVSPRNIEMFNSYHIYLSKSPRTVIHASLLPRLQHIVRISMNIEPITEEIGRFPKYDGGTVQHQQNLSK